MGGWAVHVGRGSGGLSRRYANPTIFFKAVLCFQYTMSILVQIKYLALFHKVKGN